MKINFIPYKEALALNKLGFKEKCLGWYDSKGVLREEDSEINFHGNAHAPTYCQAFKWFREKYGIISHVTSDTFNAQGEFKDYYYCIRSYHYSYTHDHRDGWDTYPEAELNCLMSLIKMF